MDITKTSANKNYAQQVNRRLAGARWQLLQLTSAQDPLPPHLQQSALESALFHCYFALLAYLNEVLHYYRRPTMDSAPAKNILESIKHDERFKNIAEIDELKQRLSDKHSLPGLLNELPHSLMRLMVAELPARTNENGSEQHDHNAIKLVDAAQINQDWQYAEVNDLLNVLSELINRQRESMVEC